MLSDLPVEILGGTLDRLLPAADHCAGMSELLPTARLTVAVGAGHMLPLERPELVTQAITRIIDAVSTPDPDPGRDSSGGTGDDQTSDGYAHNRIEQGPISTVMRITADW